MEKIVYNVNEKVLGYHQHLIYEAKILNTEYRPVDPAQKDGPKAPWYLIHYQGWNDRWDEWVLSSRILKFNDKNVAYQNSLKETHKKNTPTVAPEEPPTKKRRLDNPATDVRFDCNINQVLKKKLIEDYTAINGDKSLIPIPVQPNAKTILNDFLVSSNTQGSTVASQDIINGLVEYFDRALGKFLLYKFERPQYSTILKNHPHTSMSEIYGAEHLLRLFVKFPQLTIGLDVDPEVGNALKSTIEAVLQYMSKNVETIFGQYEPATIAYIKRIK